MTDLEMTKLCAMAMGLRIVYPDQADLPLCVESAKGAGVYFPLHDDVQAMALVKKLRLAIETIEIGAWCVWNNEQCTMHSMDEYAEGFNENLNRAIVECVAKMQEARQA